MLRLECGRISCSPRILPNFASRHGRFLTALGSFSTSMMGKRWTMNDYDRCLVVFFSNGIVTVMIKTTSIAPSPIDVCRCLISRPCAGTIGCLFQPNFALLTADVLAFLQAPPHSKRNVILGSCCAGFCWCPGTPETPLISPGKEVLGRSAVMCFLF